MDFEEHEEEMMGMGEASYDDSLVNPPRVRMPSPVQDPTPAVVMVRNSGKGRYKECLKNHAVGIGGHAVDGCREFIAAGEEGTLDALKCAACNCHRNFHRKDSPITVAGGQYHSFHRHQAPQFAACYRTPSGYLHVAPPRAAVAVPLALPANSGGGGGAQSGGEDHEEVSDPNGGGGGSNSKKRFRTKFSPEQKEKMLAFAEKVGWRLQKHDDGSVQEFCDQTGVKRQVLKVWMHNNKHTLGMKP
ncbi:ZF-HD homeobox protein, Cys/His-rich dimerization domain [Sesbania bispinosa]|nr:ZF-HD homeobox protein, Cys/His-rich dimerization domain [Sesbania bispinosa]